MTISVNAFAGDKGNGGISYVCRDNNGDITYARLLDLWEPETFTTRNDNSLSADEQFEQVMNRITKLDKYVADEIFRVDEEIQKKTIMTTKALPLTNDAIPDFAPGKGCQFEQVARYGYSNEVGENVLRIHSEIYDSKYFSNTDRAALRMHEILYLIDTTSNDQKTSQRTRRIVSRLFANEDFPTVTKKELLELVDKTLKIYLNESEVRIDVRANLDISTLKGQAAASYKISKFDDKQSTVVASSSASAKVSRYGRSTLNDFEDQTFILKSGETYSIKYEFENPRNFNSSSFVIGLKITGEDGRDYKEFFIPSTNYKYMVRVIDLSK